jgi:hypothetical protein|tara:strand:+ start:456 stop:1373 length:918 start_codon:yes stop_codon:yes gene_type:complete
MALGAYGIKRPADVSPEDVEIIVHSTPNRDFTTNFTLQKLNSAAVLSPYVHNADTGGMAGVEILGGLYNLKLPTSIFSTKGIYTVYLRPAEIRTSIVDCGILAALPNVKGLVFDINAVPAEYRNKFTPMNLVGFRIEYLKKTGQKIPNFYRIVTSNFYCEPVPANLSNPQQVSPRYVYSDSPTNLMFCTLTPTSAPTTQPNAIPFIGQPNQDVIITNTYFNPITLDIEMVDHNFDTLAVALYGNQTKSIEDGIYTMYDLSGVNNIYKQYNLFEIRDEFDEKLYEVRQDRGSNIDFTKQFNTIIAQ